MIYKLYDGIVYEKVSGVHLLIATRNAWDRFPAVKRLSVLQGCFCYGIQNHMEEEALLDYLILPPKMNKETVRKAYQRFVENMVQEGYLIAEENSDDR